MPRSVRCECGRYRDLVTNRLGAVIEVCACGVRVSLRGREPEDDPMPPPVKRAPLTDRPCQWPAGCDGFCSSYNSDFCTAHATERRKILDREYAQRRSQQRRSAA